MSSEESKESNEEIREESESGSESGDEFFFMSRKHPSEPLDAQVNSRKHQLEALDDVQPAKIAAVNLDYSTLSSSSKHTSSESESEESPAEKGLTPPPQISPIKKPEILLESFDSDSEHELDPDLQEIIRTQSINSQLTNTDNRHKVRLVIHGKRDPNASVTAQNEAKWLTFEKPITFEFWKARKVFETKKSAALYEEVSVVLLYKNSKLFNTATPESLGMTGDVDIGSCCELMADAYTLVGYSELLELQTKQQEEKLSFQPFNDFENLEHLEAPSSLETWKHFKIRDRTNHTVKLKIREVRHSIKQQTMTMQDLIAAYAKQRDISPEMIHLYFDDEIIDPALTIRETDLEDDDLLDAVII